MRLPRPLARGARPAPSGAQQGELAEQAVVAPGVGPGGVGAATAPTSHRVGYFVAINQLRGAAALLVVWAHLVGHWLTDRQLTWAPQTLVERFIAQPLGIIQHFGFLGVAIFFLISGFVITHAASKETVRVFVVRRLLRIYVPLAGALLVSLAAVRLGAPRGWNAGVPLDYADGISLGDALSAVSLVGYVTVPQVIVVGVAWTLAIEVVFYAFMAVVGPLLRRRRVPDVVVPVLLLSAVAAIVAASRSFGPSFFLFSVTCSYVPILIMGQAAYLASQRRVRLWEGLAVAGAAWAVFVWGLETLQPGFLSPGDAYGPSLTLAVGVFLVAVLAERHARTHRVLDVLAARSYSIYLVHGPVGLLVLDAAMGGGLAYRWALVAALAAAAVATEAMYRGFERPSIALARRLTRRGRSFRAGGPRT